MSEQITETNSRKELEEQLAQRQQEKLELEDELRDYRRQAAQLQEQLADTKEELKFVRTSSLDINKLSFEAMKHLTTLSAGSIVLLVTFLEKLFNTNQEWTGLVGGALISFVVSIVCAMSSMTQWPFVLTLLLISKKEDVTPVAKREHQVQRAAFLTFFIGITCLVIFAIKNLY